MSYRHIDVIGLEASKVKGAPCGDAFFCKRSAYHTTIILADGIGSGVKAHIASQMNIARLSGLLETGASLRSVFLSVVSTMSLWRDHAMPFSAFTLARILNDGLLTVLSYEMPPPIIIGQNDVLLLRAETLIVEAGVACAYQGKIDAHEALVLVSDGITQAGIGRDLAQGLGIEGVRSFLAARFKKMQDPAELAQSIMEEAAIIDGHEHGDDCSVVVAHCREGQVVNVLTGPPLRRDEDQNVVKAYLEYEGVRVVCGATTADIVARYLGGKVLVEQNPHSLSTPPRYFVDGIDLVTEGAVTLNQVYNILDEDLSGAQDKSAAGDLACILKVADRVRFMVGKAINPANSDLVFKKQGIEPRETIVPLIAERLKQMGKLVDVHFIS